KARMVSLSASAGPAEIANLITEHSLSRYPVFGSSLDEAVGVLHVKDFIRNRLAQGSVDLATILRPLPRVAGGMSAFELMTLFKTQRTHAALVVDEFGGTLGFVTMDDLVAELIDDEAGASSGRIAPQADGSMLLDGEVTLAELDEDFGLPVLHPEVSTVAGLFLAINGVLPGAGDAVEYKGVRFVAEEVRGLKVQSVRVPR
ncbi:transporter associated domain-containing protein, partial [Deinococcus sp.]|uniref:transporter associated domain-containing protein n=1 Tax=Deinococcus sp. TaxID=47478 RepID=UPI00391CA664